MKSYVSRAGEEWTIHYSPPPIPSRGADWNAVHADYDGPGDNRLVYAANESKLIEEIEALRGRQPAR